MTFFNYTPETPVVPKSHNPLYVIQNTRNPQLYRNERSFGYIDSAKKYKSLSGAKSALRSLINQGYDDLAIIPYQPTPEAESCICGEPTAEGSDLCAGCVTTETAAEQVEVMAELELDAPEPSYQFGQFQITTHKQNIKFRYHYGNKWNEAGEVYKGTVWIDTDGRIAINYDNNSYEICYSYHKDFIEEIITIIEISPILTEPTAPEPTANNPLHNDEIPDLIAIHLNTPQERAEFEYTWKHSPLEDRAHLLEIHTPCENGMSIKKEILKNIRTWQKIVVNNYQGLENKTEKPP